MRFNPITKTMVAGFKILLNYNNEVPELKKEDTIWVPTDWADHMDPNAMTTLLGDHIYNIEEEEEEEEEEYWEACQHTLRSPYELRANDEDEERGTSFSDEVDGSEDKNDSSSDSSSSDSGHGDDDSSTDSDDNSTDNDNISSRSYDIPYSERGDEDADLFYQEYDSDVDYYDQDIEDDTEANRWSDIDSDQYRLINVLENAREENAQANQMYHDK